LGQAETAETGDCDKGETEQGAIVACEQRDGLEDDDAGDGGTGKDGGFQEA